MNENIITYIKDNYINSKMEPQFAVLVKGSWGSGKTFLVKKILEETYGKKYEDKIIWLSVYGLSSIQQLRQKLFEKLHPILTSKIAKIAFATVKAGVKASTTFDFNNDKKDDFSFDLSIPDFEVDEDGQKAKIKKLLIVDDIECCSIPISELLGFFSEEILERKVRAIFISNDKKIKEFQDFESEESKKVDTLNDYESVKEKIIGMEFEVVPNIQDAVKSFIEEIGFKHNEKILIEKATTVLKSLEYDNLRSVRQAFVHISHIFSILGNDKLDEMYLANVVEYFLVLFIQKANGEISNENQFLDAIEAYSKGFQSLKTYNANHKEDKYPLFRLAKIPLQNMYFHIIQEGNFSPELILNDYKLWTMPADKRSPYQKLTYEWFNFSDTDFSSYYKSVEKDFEENKIINQSQILGWADLKFELSHKGIIPELPADIKKSFLDYIMQNRDRLETCDTFFAFANNITRCEEERESLNEIKKALKSENENLVLNQIKCKFIVLYSNISENISEFVRFIAYNEGNSFGIPLLSQIDIDDFYQKIKVADYECQVAVFQSFADRYGKEHNDKTKKEYFPDISSVKKISEFYENDSGNTLMSPENARKKWLAQWYRELYEYMKQFQENEEE